MKGETMFGSIARTTKARSAREIGWPQLRALWRHIVRLSRGTPRRLRLCENLPLGERRFVAVIEFEQSRFLVGGTSASLVLLARLESPAGERFSAFARDQIGTVGEERK